MREEKLVTILEVGPISMPPIMRKRISGHPVFLNRRLPRKPIIIITETMEKIRTKSINLDFPPNIGAGKLQHHRHRYTSYSGQYDKGEVNLQGY